MTAQKSKKYIFAEVTLVSFSEEDVICSSGVFGKGDSFEDDVTDYDDGNIHA